MGELVLTTYDWVPEMPRGFVRDLRIRWALEEAGLPYRVVTTPFRNKTSEHFAHQPFGQVPWLTDGDLSIFESGAILLHLGSRSDKLLPVDARRRNEAIEWIFAALNSVEMATQPWALLQWMGEKKDSTALKFFDDWVKVHRLKHLETVLAERDWLAGSFSVADILLADALRLVDRFEGLAASPNAKRYVERATARPAFKKAHADQIDRKSTRLNSSHT